MGVVALMGVLGVLQTVSASALEGVPPELLDVEVRAVEVDAEGVLWVGVREGGLARVADGEVEWVSTGRVRGIADLTEISGVLWATGLGGVSRRDGDGWADVELPFESRVVFGVRPGADDDQVWFGTNAGAARLRGSEWTTVVGSDGLPHGVVHQVVVEGNDVVWFLCRTGVARMEGDVLQVFRPDLNFRAGVIGPDGRPWFGTSGGLLRWTGSDFVSEITGVTLYPALTASDGALWAGSASDGVLRYLDGRWTRPVPELEGLEVFDVTEDRAGAIWIASSVGLRRLPPGTFTRDPVGRESDPHQAREFYLPF